ncbi:hypothetical protein KQY27_01965 [Methanobrevibacter sp. TMH8]|uniref:hypothetical protein n=1 Tax=Methanobrevibacter sp. TMH8 TaxID=2848611 RepID=UPI001CCA03F8|nr:hypothetical protein [Methanobrevibacter sp. TMH8]MBZ9570310.1 hypothetical protein [Methanobrevibacter sp. TMH8]
MKIENKNIKLISILIIVLIILGILITITLAINANDKKIIGHNNLGTVSIEGPYGNPNSSDKIGFIIGVHPLESNAHLSLIKNIQKDNKKLNKSYYIYVINVTKDRDDFDKGRMNGQLLAKDYVVPDIKNKNYTFVMDIHAHRNVYKEKNFIISPLNNPKSEKIGLKIIKNITGMKILRYIPAIDGHPTSPDYVSIPILKNGTSTIIYETYLNESENTTNFFMENFIFSLDQLKF